jgi:hypothetical protein
VGTIEIECTSAPRASHHEIQQYIESHVASQKIEGSTQQLTRFRTATHENSLTMQEVDSRSLAMIGKPKQTTMQAMMMIFVSTNYDAKNQQT